VRTAGGRASHAGKRSLPAMRFYGPTDAFNNKTLKLPDFGPVT